MEWKTLTLDDGHKGRNMYCDWKTFKNEIKVLKKGYSRFTVSVACGTVHQCPETDRDTSIYWTQLNRLNLKTKTASSLWNVVLQIKDK
jgi:hypothetical protein